VRFRRLYKLSVNKDCLVGDMFALELEEGERRGNGGDGGYRSGRRNC